jgi:hypothetical protein
MRFSFLFAILLLPELAFAKVIFEAGHGAAMSVSYEQTPGRDLLVVHEKVGMQEGHALKRAVQTIDLKLKRDEFLGEAQSFKCETNKRVPAYGVVSKAQASEDYVFAPERAWAIDQRGLRLIPVANPQTVQCYWETQGEAQYPFKPADVKVKEKIQAKRAQLSAADQKILEEGEMTTPRYVISGILGTYPGFGIGHAIQGRWRERGWIFTAGEIGTIMVGAASAVGCAFGRTTDSGCGAMQVAFGAYLGLKIWEAIDIWLAPALHDKRYREMKNLEQQFGLRPYLLPAEQGLTAGLIYRF